MQQLTTYPAPNRSVRSSLSADGDSADTIAHVDEEREETFEERSVNVCESRYQITDDGHLASECKNDEQQEQ